MQKNTFSLCRQIFLPLHFVSFFYWNSSYLHVCTSVSIFPFFMLSISLSFSFSFWDISSMCSPNSLICSSAVSILLFISIIIFLLLIFLFDSFYVLLLLVIRSFLYLLTYLSGWLKILCPYVLIFLFLLESVIQEVIFLLKWLSSSNVMLFCLGAHFFSGALATQAGSAYGERQTDPQWTQDIGVDQLQGLEFWHQKITFSCSLPHKTTSLVRSSSCMPQRKGDSRETQNSVVLKLGCTLKSPGKFPKVLMPRPHSRPISLSSLEVASEGQGF